MISSRFYKAGAAKRCGTSELNQELTAECGPNGTIDPQREFSALPAPSFSRFFKSHRATWPADLSEAGAIALLTLQGMQHRSFHQSQALQELAARNLQDFAEKYSAQTSQERARV